MTPAPQLQPAPDAAPAPAKEHDYHDLHEWLRRELRRYQLNFREQMVADIILEYSYGHGRMSVVIPNLQLFVDMTGISKGNIHTMLKNLHSMEVITIDGSRKQWEYSVNPNPTEWKCRERTPSKVVENAIEYIKLANGIPTLGGGTPAHAANYQTQTHLFEDTDLSEPPKRGVNFSGAVVSDSETLLRTGTADRVVPNYPTRRPFPFLE